MTARYPSLDEAVNQIAELRPLSLVATQVLEIAEGDRFSAHELASVISSDQALTAKMLRLSNSAYYGFPRRITTVRDAVVLLGFRAVRSATIASCVIEAVPGSNHIEYDTFWRYSISVGLLAEVLGRAERIHQDEAFTAGVLHNIGRLALDQHYPQALADGLTIARKLDISVHNAQRELLDWTDADLGGGLARHWNFPEALAESVQHHQLDPDALPDPRTLPAFVVRARIYARATGLSDSIDEVRQEDPPNDWSIPPVSVALRRAGGFEGVMERVGAFIETTLVS